MSPNLKDLAKNAIAIDPILDGRNKITIEDLIAQYPDGVSIDGFSIYQPVNKIYPECPVFSFVEDGTKYFNDGKALKEMVTAWLDSYDNNRVAINEELKKSPVKVKLEKIILRNGNKFTKVTVVDDEKGEF